MMNGWLGMYQWWDENGREYKPVLNTTILSNTNPSWIGLESNLSCGG